LRRTTLPGTQVLLGLGAAQYVTAAGLGELPACAGPGDRDGRLILCDAAPLVAEILSVTHLDRVSTSGRPSPRCLPGDAGVLMGHARPVPFGPIHASSWFPCSRQWLLEHAFDQPGRIG
jgi:hypothetical protein